MATTEGPERAPADVTADRVRHQLAPEPNGCRWCGTGEREHASRFVRSVGQHLFTPPTSAQRLARMRARFVTTRPEGTSLP